MIPHPYLPLVQHISRHALLTEAEQQHIMRLFRYRRVRKRQLILQAGDPCLVDSFVVTGALKCSITDLRGVEHVLYFAVDDWWAADHASFLGGTPATWDIEATEDSELLQIDYAGTQALYEAVPTYERFSRIMFQRAYLALQERIFGIYSLTAEQRYTAFLQKYPNMSQRFAQKHIASFLGVTPEYLSKIRPHIEPLS